MKTDELQVALALRLESERVDRHRAAFANLRRALEALDVFAEPVRVFLRAGEVEPIDVEQLGAHATVVVVTAKALYDALEADAKKRSEYRRCALRSWYGARIALAI
jgi:hypothetical protein